MAECWWMVGCPEAVGGRDTPHALGAVVFFGRVGGDLVGTTGAPSAFCLPANAIA